MMIRLTDFYGDTFFLQSKFIEEININDERVTEIRMFHHPGVVFTCKETPAQVAGLVNDAEAK